MGEFDDSLADAVDVLTAGPASHREPFLLLLGFVPLPLSFLVPPLSASGSNIRRALRFRESESLLSSSSSSTSPNGLEGCGMFRIAGARFFFFFFTNFVAVVPSDIETFGAGAALCCRRRHASKRFRFRSAAVSSILTFNLLFSLN